MQIYNVNNSYNFGAKIKINKELHNHISEASTTSAISGSGATVLSGMASEMIAGAAVKNSDILISKFSRAINQIKSFIKALNID